MTFLTESIEGASFVTVVVGNLFGVETVETVTVGFGRCSSNPFAVAPLQIKCLEIEKLILIGSLL